MDEQAQAEAWVRKPRRIIHSYPLILLLGLLAALSPVPLAGLVVWAAFAVAPSIVIPTLIALWAITLTVYTSLRLYYRNH